MWHTVREVATGTSLMAFAISAGVTLYRVHLGRDLKLIGKARPEERAALIDKALDRDPSVNTESLTREQKYDLLLSQLRARRFRFGVGAVIVLALSLVAAGVAVFALSQPSLEKVAQTATPVPTSPPSTPAGIGVGNRITGDAIDAKVGVFGVPAPSGSRNIGSSNVLEGKGNVRARIGVFDSDAAPAKAKSP